MKTYLLHQQGREPVELEAYSDAEAKAQLRYMAKQEKFRCRIRYGKDCGHLHKVNEHQFLVTVGSDARSSIWTTLSLQVV